MFLFQKVRLPIEVPQYEEERQHEHIDRRRKAGQMIIDQMVQIENIFWNINVPLMICLMQSIWVPKLVFSNTEQKIITKNDEKAFAVAR